MLVLDDTLDDKENMETVESTNIYNEIQGAFDKQEYDTNKIPVRLSRGICELLVMDPQEKTNGTRMICYMSKAVGIILTQMHEKKGSELCGERAIAVIFK